MSMKLKALCLACCLFVLTPALADYSSLQMTVTGLSGQTVTVSVHNPTSVPVPARVRVLVSTGDATFLFLTSGNFTVAGGATTSISLSAAHPVAEIEDDPEPIGAM